MQCFQVASFIANDKRAKTSHEDRAARRYKIHASQRHAPSSAKLCPDEEVAKQIPQPNYNRDSNLPFARLTGQNVGREGPVRRPTAISID